MTKTNESVINITIRTMSAEIESRKNMLAWIKKHKAIFDALPFEAGFYNGQVDFDNLTHDKIRQVIRAFKAGKWNKTAKDGAKVDYETTFDGVKIRCWNGAPPPNCKVVTEEIHVPAHTTYIQKLVCPKSTLQPVA